MDTSQLERRELIGREDILKKLHVNYFPGHWRHNGVRIERAHWHLKPCTQVLCGLSGIGKTAIAHEYIRRHLPGHIAGRESRRRRGCAERAQKATGRASVQHCYTGGVLRLNLASSHDFISSVQHAKVLTTAASLTQANPAPRRLACSTVDELSRWLRATSDWLLVLDNVDDWDTLAAEECAAWQSLLPSVSDAGHCLVITQSCVLPEWLQRRITCTTEVPPLSTPNAYRLFKRTFAGCRASEVRPPVSDATAAGSLRELFPREKLAIQALVGTDGPLSGVPLAVEMTAAYAKTQHAECRGEDDGPVSCVLGEASLAERIQRLFEESAASAKQLPRDSGSGDVAPDVVKSAVRKEHVAMLRLMSAVLSKLSPSARQLCLLLAFLNPDRVGLGMFAIGKEALPTELREAIGDTGEHGLLQLACELRRFGLVQFGDVAQRSPGPATAGRASCRLAGAAVLPAAKAPVQCTLSVHRLVQWSIRNHVTGGCSLDGRTAARCPGRWPEHWTVRSTLGMLSTAAMDNSRLYNEVHLMPHMVAFYSAVFTAESSRWERECEAAAAPRPVITEPSDAGAESSLPVRAIGAAGASEVAAARLQWCFFLDELLQLYRARHSMMPPWASVLVRREAGLLLQRSAILDNADQLPASDKYLLENPEMELTDATVVTRLKMFTMFADCVPRRFLLHLYQASMILALLWKSVYWTEHFWPCDEPELNKWLTFGKWTERGRPGDDPGNTEEARGLLLQLVCACHTMWSGSQEVMFTLLYRAGFPESTGVVLSRAIATVARHTQHIQSLIGGSCVSPGVEVPLRVIDGFVDSAARSGEEHFCQLIRRGVVRRLLSIRYNIIYNSALPAALSTLPIQVALVMCFGLSCSLSSQQRRQWSSARQGRLVLLERMKAMVTRSRDVVLAGQMRKGIDLLFYLAADHSRLDCLAQDVKQQESLD